MNQILKTTLNNSSLELVLVNNKTNLRKNKRNPKEASSPTCSRSLQEHKRATRCKLLEWKMQK